jgi:Cdc6-like AAA superfamily ATPase
MIVMMFLKTVYVTRLMIVDEMDYLITRDQAVLYDLFRLPTFPNSCCILIGKLILIVYVFKYLEVSLVQVS